MIFSPRTTTLPRGDRLAPPPALSARDAKGGVTAWVLTALGVLPFLAAALVLLFTGPQSLWFAWTVDVMRTYGAVILSFLGGIRWGAALHFPRAPGAGLQYALSVVPSLVGWLALFMPPAVGLAWLAAMFALQGVWDAYSGPSTTFSGSGVAPHGTERGGWLPLWFVRLRVLVTVAVVLCLLAALVAGMR